MGRNTPTGAGTTWPPWPGDPGSRRSSLLRWALTAIVVAVLLLAGGGLRGSRLGSPEIAPNGIVSFELAGTVERARPIVDLWEGAGKLGEAELSLWLDFGFILLYGLVLYLWVAWSQHRLHPSGTRGGWAVAGVAAVAAVLLAGLADVVENVLLLRVLDGPTAATTAWARVLAWTKFGLIGAVAGYVGAASLAALLQRRRSPRAPA